MASVDKSFLSNLDPVSSLSPKRMEELAGLCYVEAVSKDLDPLRMNIVKNSQAVYLLQGELAISFVDGRKQVIRGGSIEARQPIAGGRDNIKSALALSDIKIVRIDTDLLDIMMTWDQLAGYERSVTRSKVLEVSGQFEPDLAGWMGETGTFSAAQLQTGLFSKLPPENVEEMFRRMTSEPVKAEQVIITQGGEGDYYYLIERGVAEVTRSPGAGQPSDLLAVLHEGQAFGEDALVSEGKRNATVTMKTDGILLRLKKTDFVELLQAPLLAKISIAEVEAKVASGASPIWLDVRFPSEYRFNHLPGAINVPLQEIRDYLRTLDSGKEYITYCQSGRRSSAAAFIMAQHGIRVFVLDGGAQHGALRSA